MYIYIYTVNINTTANTNTHPNINTTTILLTHVPRVWCMRPQYMACQKYRLYIYCKGFTLQIIVVCGAFRYNISAGSPAKSTLSQGSTRGEHICVCVCTCICICRCRCRCIWIWICICFMYMYMYMHMFMYMCMYGCVGNWHINIMLSFAVTLMNPGLPTSSLITIKSYVQNPGCCFF